MTNLDPKRPAYTLYAAAKKIVPSLDSWEPEAWMAELRDEGQEISDLLVDKLCAAIAVVNTDAFYLEPRVFEKCVAAFSNGVVIQDAAQEPRPHHMVWAMHVASELRKEGKRTLNEPDDDVDKYIAIVLHRHGFVTAPDGLECAEEYLEGLAPVGAKIKTLRDQVRSSWAKLRKSELTTDLALTDETPLEVQVNNLLYCQLYKQARLNA